MGFTAAMRKVGLCRVPKPTNFHAWEVAAAAAEKLHAITAPHIKHFAAW